MLDKRERWRYRSYMENTSANQAPKLEAFRVAKDGKPAVKFAVRFATSVPALDALTLSLGFVCSVDISNTREWTSNDPTQIKAVQDALRPFFTR